MRLTKLNALKTDAWYGKTWDKLSQNEKDICVKFIMDNAQENKDEFTFALNRLFLNTNKPKRWTAILDILQSIA